MPRLRIEKIVLDGVGVVNALADVLAGHVID
jgi:hypothetical protein